jgi:vacuolar-type H+-ATPase subunit C/Vma6
MFGMEMNTFNINDGYAEACVRALSKGFLREENYNSLIACNNLAEFKLVLDETDYGKYIIQNDGAPLDVNQLKRNMYRKLRDEIEYLMGQASAPLSQFLEKMMHCY